MPSPSSANSTSVSSSSGNCGAKGAGSGCPGVGEAVASRRGETWLDLAEDELAEYGAAVGHVHPPAPFAAGAKVRGEHRARRAFRPEPVRRAPRPGPGIPHPGAGRGEGAGDGEAGGTGHSDVSLGGVGEEGFELVEAVAPRLRSSSIHWRAASSPSGLSRRGRAWAARECSIRPASSSSFKWRETAARLCRGGAEAPRPSPPPERGAPVSRGASDRQARRIGRRVCSYVFVI